MTLTFDTLAPKVNAAHLKKLKTFLCCVSQEWKRLPGKSNGRLTLTGFSIFVQLESRRTPAVEASNGVTAESLATPVRLLAFIHIWGQRRCNPLKIKNKTFCFGNRHLHVTESVSKVIEGDPKHNCRRLCLFLPSLFQTLRKIKNKLSVFQIINHHTTSP